MKVKPDALAWFATRGISPATLALAQEGRGMLSQERLKYLLHYDPETGIFTHRVTRSGVVAGSRAGTIGASGYIGLRIDGERHSAHRLAFLWMTGQFPANEVDHINRVRHDNRWINLRPATRQENCRNFPLKSRDLPRGVYRSGPKYRVRIRSNGRSIHLGSFATVEEASRVYESHAVRFYGEFA
jgi:hypothetical protein